MATIVISYRRADSKWIAGRIFDRLESRYGKGNVFMDIDSIPFGLDFREHIRETLSRCDVMLAIIGPNWVGKEETGEHILDETDWVRIEVEAALKRKIPVIPVLVDRLRLPKPNELPEGLKDLAYRQAAGLDSEHFHSHMDKVISSIDQHLSKLDRPQSPPTPSPAADAAPSLSPVTTDSTPLPVKAAVGNGKQVRPPADTSVAVAGQFPSQPVPLPSEKPPLTADSGASPPGPAANGGAADGVDREETYGSRFETKFTIIGMAIAFLLFGLIYLLVPH